VDVTHLYLHVRDRARSAVFYRRWFGLRLASTGNDIRFLKGDRDVLLALMDDLEPQHDPHGLHFGARLDTSGQVCDMARAMAEAGVPIAKPLSESDALVAFRCADPDSHVIEVYRQP
jgi:catechol-2,3-dioxygenase